MKKYLVVILAAVLLTVSAGAAAEGNAQDSLQPEQQQEQAQTQDEQKDNSVTENGKKKKQKPQSGQSGGTDAVSGATKTVEEQPDSRQPDDAQAQGSDRQDGSGQNGKQFLHGQKPGAGQMRKGSLKPQGGSGPQNEQSSEQKQTGKHRPGNRRNSGETAAPQAGQVTGEAAFPLDLDSFVAQGIIRQETADQIIAYAQVHSPGDASADPAELLKGLLDAKIITQVEYDAMLAAQTAAAV